TWQWYCVLLIITWHHCCFPHTFYVDINHQNCNDSNKGTLTNPWKTIQHAVDILLPGDTVFIKQGSYYENLTTQRSGNTTDGYITFSAYPQETPVINGTGVAASNTGFTITHSYIHLIGLELKNWINGIWMEEADNVLISACEIHQVVYGIGAADATHDFRFDRVVMHHFDLYGFDASPSGGKDCYNGKFYNCISHTGRDDTQNVDGFALGHGTQHNFIFDKCLTYNVYDGFDLSSRNTTLTGCTAHECWNSGFKIWQDSVTLINCLSYNNAIANVEIDWNGNAKKVSLINCTFHQADTYNIWSQAEIILVLLLNNIQLLIIKVITTSFIMIMNIES
ncbi:MAG: right-handed parallel beta-helix repeat-containing protein, partial [bacterium]